MNASTSLGSIDTPNFERLISATMLAEIKEVEYFARSQYSNLDIIKTLEFYTNRYVKQLPDFTSIDRNTTIVDVGAGFGWLSMAFALTTPAKIVAFDANEPRLKAGEKIAKILGLQDRIIWKTGVLGSLPLKDKEADIVYCIEVIEHVERSKAAIEDLCRISRNLVIATTPNLWFPIIAHDTQLPFCHWLPIPLRKIYAKLFNREDREVDNLFWSPYSLQKAMRDFKPISPWLHYASYKNYRATFPYYLPYGRGRDVRQLGSVKKIYYDLVARLGIYSHWLLPSLAYVFQRR